MEDETVAGVAEEVLAVYKDRVVEMVEVKASDLLHHNHNPSIHTEDQKIIMASLLDSTGFAATIKGRRVEGGIEILDGHLRADLAGDSIVPVLILDLNDEEADMFLLTFDPISAMAKQITSKVAALRNKAVTLDKSVIRACESVNAGIAAKAEARAVEVRQLKQRLATIQIGQITIPCNPDEIAELIVFMSEYGDANGSFVGFGTYLLRAIGALGDKQA